MERGKILGGVEVTPELVARLFWGLGSDGQADFFAEMHRLAGYKLCLQMAAVVADMAERTDTSASEGFRTMFAHADAYPEAANEWRAMRAKSAIARVRSS